MAKAYKPRRMETWPTACVSGVPAKRTSKAVYPADVVQRENGGFVNPGSGFDSLRRLQYAGPRKGCVYLMVSRSPWRSSCAALVGSIPTLGSNDEGGITVQKEAQFAVWKHSTDDENYCSNYGCKMRMES